MRTCGPPFGLHQAPEMERFLRGAFARYPTREDRSFEDRSFGARTIDFRPTTGFFSYAPFRHDRELMDAASNAFARSPRERFRASKPPVSPNGGRTRVHTATGTSYTSIPTTTPSAGRIPSVLPCLRRC